MQDPVLDIWNNLTVEGDPVILNEIKPFECTQKTPFVKGLFNNPDVLGNRARFMCVRVAMRTYSGEELLDEGLATLNFFQVNEMQWGYAMADGGTYGTFRNAIFVCRHTVELIERLVRGEDGEAMVVAVDDEQLVVKMRPAELLN